MVDVRNGGGEAGSFKPVNHSTPEPARDDGDAHPTAASKLSAPSEDMPPSKTQSKTSSTRNSTPAAAASDSRHAAQSSTNIPGETEQQQQQQQSQATITAASNSSQATSKEPEEVAAAPYGTRSRNRPGRSRINYAEDSAEMDFEMAPAATNGNNSEPPSRGSVATDSGQSVGVGGKKGSGAGQGNAPWGNNVGPNQKDNPPPNVNTPGASSSAAKPAINQKQQPKRRKNAAANSTNGNHANAAAAPSQAAARRPAASNTIIAANNTRESNMMTFAKTGAMLKDGHLEADDGQIISVDDQVYLVCEPPGEPYYLCRVMEFLHANGDPKARVDSMRVNWFYRPRDVQRYNNDTRLVYATMHSDICPLTSLRGRCHITHRSEIDNLDEYRKTRDSFWYNQLFDRFIHRWYDVIPTSQVINVPEKVKKALDERWKYICLETSRVKELTSAVKTCKRCVGFCASNDSVECAVCRNTYHMNCVRPPLLKKPSRGFAWACGPCSRAQEKKLEARRTPLLGSGNEEGDEEELLDEEEEEAGGETTAPSPNDSETQVDLHPGTQAEIALAKMWPMRYLGIHCRVEDALQYDDRAIYPRASSRLGPRHQANVNVWHGRPVELVKPAEIKKRYVKAAGKKDTKLSKETVAAMEADKAEKAKRPKWVMDEPPGYVRRGEDYPNKDNKCTAELMFKMPPLGVHSSRGEDDAPTCDERKLREYMEEAKRCAHGIGVMPWSTNFLDKALSLFTKHQYDANAALRQLKKMDKRKDLKEPPELTKDEEKKWCEGVAKYGSEIRSVRLHTSKNMFYGDAVRYYYMWKKTPKGKEIWGSYTNRKGRNKKAESDVQSRLVDDVADDHDDSAFDNEKAASKKRGFQCKFCSTRHSRQWRRAPNVAPGQTVAADGRASKTNSSGFVLALCQRCASLWRKYAVKWENTDEIAKKVAQGGGKAWKRRIDEELLKEVYAAASEGGVSNGTPEYSDTPPAHAQPVTEPPKKKQKLSAAAAAADSGTSTPYSEPVSKKKEKEKPAPPPRAPTPPIIPTSPRLRPLPCAVCRSPEGLRLECAACRLTVHKYCYGIDEVRHPKWYCDTCKNDKKESVSYNYECVLCPQAPVEQDFYEPPKVSHKKKTDREREKERLEKELVDKAKDEYRHKQQEKGRPVIPRDPMKRTADNNWVHVYCALWTPETKFTSPARLDMVEGVGAPTLRYDAVCKICKTANGACVSCLQCHGTFHIGCAHNAGYTFGFDITPVKATRRDAVPTVTLNGETGTMAAAIWCKDHASKNIVHPMDESVAGSDLVALQLFAREFKQADLTLTGTARKANLVDQSTRIVPVASTTAQNGRRTSTIPNQTPTSARGRQSITSLVAKQEESAETSAAKPERRCAKCSIDVSPRWWKIDDSSQAPQIPAPTNSMPTANGTDVTRAASSESAVPLDKARAPNGSIDHIMTDAPPVRSPDRPSRLRVDTDISIERAGGYLCQKCHWKKFNAPEESPEERERSKSAIPEPPPPLPLRSPPVQSTSTAPTAPPPPPPLPPAIGGTWLPGTQNLPSQHQQGPPIGWYPNGPPPPPPPGPAALHNGIAHPPPTGAPLGPPSTFHSPYPPIHQPNGFPPYSGPPTGMPAGLPPLPPGLRPGPPLAAIAPPPHIAGSTMMNGIHSNGMQSPRVPYSPTHPHGHGSARSTESPFNAPPPPMQYPGLHHGSPVPGSVRPSTPRDTVMRDAPPATAPTERPNTGASASPSLRNLLH